MNDLRIEAIPDETLELANTLADLMANQQSLPVIAF
jgi:hypothetical protein